MKTSIVHIIAALRDESLDSDRLEKLLHDRQLDGNKVSLSNLRQALDALEQFFDEKKAKMLRSRIVKQGGTIGWRPMTGSGRLVPVVKVRLDRYIDQLDISPPDARAGNGRRYSEQRVRIEYLPDRVVIHTDKLATDAFDDEEEGEDG